MFGEKQVLVSHMLYTCSCTTLEKLATCDTCSFVVLRICNECNLNSLCVIQLCNCTLTLSVATSDKDLLYCFFLVIFVIFVLATTNNTANLAKDLM